MLPTNRNRNVSPINEIKTEMESSLHLLNMARTSSKDALMFHLIEVQFGAKEATRIATLLKWDVGS
jgi:hypothetical protein